MTQKTEIVRKTSLFNSSYNGLYKLKQFLIEGKVNTFQKTNKKKITFHSKKRMDKK